MNNQISAGIYILENLHTQESDVIKGIVIILIKYKLLL